MHDNGILHRHFAARHILLDVSGKCCITNFSESITEKQLERQSSNNDSYNFIATTPPEVMTNKTYTKKSDVYSFAIAAWEILTREIPFNGTQPIDAQIKIVKQNKRPPQMNIPDDIYLLLNKCWDLNPDNRPDLTDVAMELNAKLYKYRLLAKGHLMQRSGGGISSGSSIQGPTSIYSAPTQLQTIQSNSATPGNDTQQAFKRPSLVPVKYNVSAPYPGQANVQRFSTPNITATTDIKNQSNNGNNNNPSPTNQHPANLRGLSHGMPIPPNVPSLQNRNTDTHLLHSNYQHQSPPQISHDMRRVSGPITQQYTISKLPQSHPQLQYHYTYNGPSPRQNPLPSSAPNPTININISPTAQNHTKNSSPVSRSSQRLRHGSPPPMPLSSPNSTPNRNSNENNAPNIINNQNHSNSNTKLNDHGTRNSTASPPPFLSPSASNNNNNNNTGPISYNGSKTLYSQSDYAPSSLSAISPNNGPPPQPISPPPNNYNVTTSPAQMQQIINPTNIILENINSQSVIQ